MPGSGYRAVARRLRNTALQDSWLTNEFRFCNHLLVSCIAVVTRDCSRCFQDKTWVRSNSEDKCCTCGADFFFQDKTWASSNSEDQRCIFGGPFFPATMATDRFFKNQHVTLFNDNTTRNERRSTEKLVPIRDVQWSCKSLARQGMKGDNVSVRMAPISFGALPCRKKKTWWQLASRCCWNRARPWHAYELVSFLVWLKTSHHPGIWNHNQQIWNSIHTKWPQILIKS